MPVKVSPLLFNLKLLRCQDNSMIVDTTEAAKILSTGWAGAQTFYDGLGYRRVGLSTGWLS